MLESMRSWWAMQRQTIYLWPKLRGGGINWVLRKERYAVYHYGEVDHYRQARLKKKILERLKSRRIRHRLRLHVHMDGCYYQ